MKPREKDPPAGKGPPTEALERLVQLTRPPNREAPAMVEGAGGKQGSRETLGEEALKSIPSPIN